MKDHYNGKLHMEEGWTDECDLDGKISSVYKTRQESKEEKEARKVRLERERRINHCIYLIENHRVTARALENDAKNAEKHGDFGEAKSLLHAAAIEWQQMEFNQQQLLDLTRE